MNKQVSTEQKTYDNSLDSHTDTDTDTEEYKLDNHRKSWKGLCERAWYQFQSQVGVEKFTKDIVSIFTLWLLLAIGGSSLGVSSFTLVCLLCWSTAINVSIQDIHTFSMGYILSISLGIAFVVEPFTVVLSFILFSIVYMLMLSIKPLGI